MMDSYDDRAARRYALLWEKYCERSVFYYSSVNGTTVRSERALVMEDVPRVSNQLGEGRIEEDFEFGPFHDGRMVSGKIIELAKDIIGRHRYQDIVARQDDICEQLNQTRESRMAGVQTLNAA